MAERLLASGNEAVAMAAFDCGVRRGTGYPGTPSSEILDEFSKLGGAAEWAPNEKVALEVAIGVAFARGRSLVTMKHVGLNGLLLNARRMMSYLGWFTHSDTYNVFTSRVRPYVSIRRLRLQIRRHDRRVAA